MKAEDIYRNYFEDVYRYILCICADEELACEITQQTFFKAMFSLHTFRGDCDIKIWLLKIAKNIYYSHLRKNKKLVEFPQYDLPDNESLSSLVEDRDTAMHIRRILQTLNEPYKEVFTMRVITELPFEEIGAAFGKSAHWACVTYHRAKEKIKKQLEE